MRNTRNKVHSLHAGDFIAEPAVHYAQFKRFFIVGLYVGHSIHNSRYFI
jgi:hypothetical protein